MENTIISKIDLGDSVFATRRLNSSAFRVRFIVWLSAGGPVEFEFTCEMGRNAWNEAMRSAAGAAALPPSLQARTQKRRSDRRKKQDRRDKARKVSSLVGGGADGEGQEILAAAWMDALEAVPASAATADDDDSYDELEDDQDTKGGSNKRKRSGGRRSGGGGDAAKGVMPKRLKPRTVASILLEEVNRDDGVARSWLDAEARMPPERQVPRRKFCPVTGMEGVYTEPKTGIPYAKLSALEQIRERPPPWMTLGGALAFHEAARSIRDE